MNLQTEIPVVGEKIKAGDPLFGPICIIEKIQRVDRIDTEGSEIKKWKLMPQEEEFDPKVNPDKQGYDEMLMIPIVVDGNINDIKQFYIVWCNHEKKVPSSNEILERIYNKTEKMDQIKEVMEMMFWGTKFDEMAAVMNDIDISRINPSATVSLIVILRKFLDELKDKVNVEDLFDRIEKAFANSEETKNDESINKYIQDEKSKILERL